MRVEADALPHETDGVQEVFGGRVLLLLLSTRRWRMKHRERRRLLQIGLLIFRECMGNDRDGALFFVIGNISFDPADVLEAMNIVIYLLLL